jgi:hypothetical protein
MTYIQYENQFSSSNKVGDKYDDDLGLNKNELPIISLPVNYGLTKDI